MGFRSSILAGTKLIREAIQSSNYIPGSAGWTVNRDGTAEFADLTIRSSDGGGATVEIENGKAIFTAANGWQIIIDPTNDLPIIYFRDGEGDEAGAINATGDNSRAGLNVSSGPFTVGATPEYRWVNTMGEFTSGGNAWQVTRSRPQGAGRAEKGAFAYLSGTLAQIGYQDSDAPATNSVMQVDSTTALLDELRLFVSARPSTLPAFRVLVDDPGHTGFLLHLQREASVKFTVDKDGNAAALGNVTALGNVSGANVSASGTLSGAELSVADTTFTTYTPVMTGHGTAVYTSTGWYYAFGDLVYVHAYVQCSVAGGTGSTVITLSLPFTPDRSSRQYLPVYSGGIAAGSNSATGGTAVGNINPTGSGAMIDQIRSSVDVLYRAYNLSATATFTVDGWFRRI